MAVRASKRLIVGISLAAGMFWTSSAHALWDCGRWFYGNPQLGRGGFYRDVCIDDRGGRHVGQVLRFGTREQNDWLNFWIP